MGLTGSEYVTLTNQLQMLTQESQLDRVSCLTLENNMTYCIDIVETIIIVLLPTKDSGADSRKTTLGIQASMSVQ